MALGRLPRYRQAARRCLPISRAWRRNGSRAADRCRWQRRFARPDVGTSIGLATSMPKTGGIAAVFRPPMHVHTPGFASTASQQSSMCGSTERTSCVPTAYKSRTWPTSPAFFRNDNELRAPLPRAWPATGRSTSTAEVAHWLGRQPTASLAPYGTSGTHARLVPSCRASGPVACNSAPVRGCFPSRRDRRPR
jgi:hypothetical protein